MELKHVEIIARELTLKPQQVAATIALLDEGATVPFISRYRKEATESLDEVAVTAIRDRIEQLRELDKRRAAILDSIDKQGKLTPELKDKINTAKTMTALEDLYLPYKPKRRTRATIAKEKGLEPLAKLVLDQTQADINAEATRYIDTEKGVETTEQAIAGARDIVAEWIAEDSAVRENIRSLFRAQGVFQSKVLAGKEEEAVKYKDYYDFSEPVAKIPSHRILAIRRGSKEGLISLHITVEEEKALQIIESHILKPPCPSTPEVKLAILDGFKRLLAPSMETEIRLETKKRADEEAIRVFADNLRNLLLTAPLGQKNVLALDPGFRTGCKLICLDRQGKLLYDDVVYIHQSQHQAAAEGEKIKALCGKFRIEAIAVGNGTAGRETETFLRGLGLDKKIQIVMVNESGASVYSASKVAREEFPDHDLTVRGAVSIGRRLMDPLAELVKIDPKSIGVGQYQHDVDQNNLKQSLDDTVVSCVNAVGVEVNTASKQLLTYVSGVGSFLAENIVEHRNQNGPFASRTDLKNIKGMGPRTFEQSAGFLRIRSGGNPLDASAVHPESYHVVDAICDDLRCTVNDLMQNGELRDKIELDKYITATIGLPTLVDIRSELAKPGRDPREEFDAFQFAEGINEMKDLSVGMKLPGIVTNVTAFGAFVDIGVHQDGLVHISEMSDRFVKDPSEIVKVHQKVTVTITEVDIQRKRISLSMKTQPSQADQPSQTTKPAQKPKPKSLKPGPAVNRKKGQTAPKSKNNDIFGESLGIKL